MKKIAVVLVMLAVVGCKRAEKPVAPAKTDTARGQGYGTDKTDTTTTTGAKGTEIGAMMPDFSAKYLDGTPFSLANTRNKVVLLNLWATWCPPCRVETPELQRIHQAYSARGFEVIGVSVDQEGVGVVKEFVESEKIAYPMVHDELEKLPLILETSVLPTSVLLDRNGRIVWKKVGAIFPGDQELEQAIEKSL